MVVVAGQRYLAGGFFETAEPACGVAEAGGRGGTYSRPSSAGMGDDGVRGISAASLALR
jgi:hypothetical protein